MQIFVLNATCRNLNNRYKIVKTKVGCSKSDQPKAALRKSNILSYFSPLITAYQRLNLLAMEWGTVQLFASFLCNQFLPALAKECCTDM